jgi:hypothetical protein
VLRRIDGPLDDTVPAKRDITVRDLLAFTLGFGLLFDNPPIQQRIDELKLVNGKPVPLPRRPTPSRRFRGATAGLAASAPPSSLIRTVTS